MHPAFPNRSPWKELRGHVQTAKNTLREAERKPIEPRQNDISAIRSLERFVLGRVVARRVNLLLAQHYPADPETRPQSEHEPLASTLRFDEGDCGLAVYVTARIVIEIAKLLARRLQETHLASI
ncbi:unnamed protein product [Clonostachys chloroleuca]|uniref:Uncharacterized protein n=1 Tax=Clonostachys chloroleuca TaxID=1926264 RepID=A0AA35MJN8_9HYPO|nr:unnamed protein product [Clonostachys chloroleuca]